MAWVPLETEVSRVALPEKNRATPPAAVPSPTERKSLLLSQHACPSAVADVQEVACGRMRPSVVVLASIPERSMSPTEGTVVTTVTPSPQATRFCTNPVGPDAVRMGLYVVLGCWRTQLSVVSSHRRQRSELSAASPQRVLFPAVPSPRLTVFESWSTSLWSWALAQVVTSLFRSFSSAAVMVDPADADGSIESVVDGAAHRLNDHRHAVRNATVR